MRKIKYILFSISSLFGSVFWAQEVGNEAYHKMLQRLLSHNVPEKSVEDITEDKTYVFLDTRAKNEYGVSHIKGAIWVGYDEFKMQSVANIPRDAEIIVYCSVGYRSEKITHKLIKNGYTNISNLYGGFFEWCNTGKPMVTTENKPTLKIHPYDEKWGKWLTKGIKSYEK